MSLSPEEQAHALELSAAGTTVEVVQARARTHQTLKHGGRYDLGCPECSANAFDLVILRLAAPVAGDGIVHLK